MNRIKYFFVALAISLAFTGCSEDPVIIAKKTKVVVNLLDPSDAVKITEFKDVKITLTELNTQEKTEQKVTGKTITLEVNQGSYEVSVGGKITYNLNGVTKEGNVAGIVNELNLISEQQSKDIQLSLKSFSKDFIIEEIFFTGTLTPAGGSYYGDQYFKLYNNTDQTLYADGLILAQSKFLTVEKHDYTPNIMAQAFTTVAMTQIPGSGKDHPVEPGKSIVIALDGINHLENNTNSVDLSKSDFEIFDVNSSDVDNPNVPNMIRFHDKVVPHSRGFNSYVIARLPEGVTKASYLSDYKYDYEWLFVLGTIKLPQKESDYKIPNEWVLDAVNMSVESEFKWIVTDPSLDSGYTYCGKVNRDATRYGKSVRRKVLQNINGVRLLQDTNNSAVDFIPEASLSLK